MESFHRTVVGIPALLGNPHFKMTEFLKQRIGDHTPTEEEVRDWYVPLAEIR